VSGRRGSGSFGSGRTAGYAYAIGEGRTSPWLEAIAGIRDDHVPGWAPSPCRLPGPVSYPARYEVRCGRDRDSSTPFRAPVSVCGAGCAGRSARGAVGVWASGRQHTRRLGRHRLEPKDPVVTVGEALAAAAASAVASGPPLRLTRNDTPCRSGSFLRPSSSCRH